MLASTSTGKKYQTP